MNKFFVMLRFLMYIMLFSIFLYYSGPILGWIKWIMTFMAIGWGTWDLWKKPDESLQLMRRGVWTEMVVISFWVFLLQGYILLFAFISPLIRSSVHLKFLDRITVFILSVGFVSLFVWGSPGSNIWIPFIVFVTLTIYGSIIGEFMNEREKARRLIVLSSFEREQMVRDQERVRISHQLHDTMGQYWTAVIRSIDVAVALDLPKKETYLLKAREAAEQGLKEMREAVQRWNEGKQTPSQWMQFAVSSIERLKELTQIDIQVQLAEIDWNRFNRSIEVSEFISRSILESLTNAIRHGYASKAWILIKLEETRLRVIVRDNGIGFSIGEELSQGIGFISLQQMAKDIGGELQVESAPNHGTTVHLAISYHR
jgi:signal transduction histidine kinase